MEVLARMRAGHERDLGRLEVERVDPAGLDQRHDAEWLDAAPQVGDAIRIAQAADEGAVDIDLDDVAAMNALLDPAAHLADEDRGRPPGRAGGRGPGRARRRPGDRSGRGGRAGGPLDGRHDHGRIARRSLAGIASGAVPRVGSGKEMAGSTRTTSRGHSRGPSGSNQPRRTVHGPPLVRVVDECAALTGRPGRSRASRPCYDFGRPSPRIVAHHIVATIRPTPGGPS